MSFDVKVTKVDITRCDGCGYEGFTRRGDDGERYPPTGWKELPTGEHTCSRVCQDLIRERAA